jgi:hypothetical protein
MKLSKLSRIELLSVISIAAGITSGVIGVGAASASAASPAAASPSTIARSVVRADKLQAMAGTLNLTTAQTQADLKAHSLKQVVASAGLTKTTFRQKVQAQMQTELQAQGYNQTQITAALQHFQKHARQK